MDQPLRPDDVFPNIREVCPECRGEHTTEIASTSGVYCRCADCGHVWHKDRVVLHWSLRCSQMIGRQTDACPRCGSHSVSSAA